MALLTAPGPAVSVLAGDWARRQVLLRDATWLRAPPCRGAVGPGMCVALMSAGFGAPLQLSARHASLGLVPCRVLSRLAATGA